MAYRVGLVGTGGIARAHGKACQQIAEAELVAICDVSAEQLARYGEEFGVAARYTELDAMLREAELDIAIICTWGAFHAETGIQTLRFGAGKSRALRKALHPKRGRSSGLCRGWQEKPRPRGRGV